MDVQPTNENLNTKSVEYRVTMLGGGGVGKSSVLIRFINGQFYDEYDPTIELDTAGREELTFRIRNMYKDEHGYIMVYNITDRNSFDELSNFQGSLLRERGNQPCAVVVVGNKCDLESDRCVTKEEGRILAKQWGYPFFETSSKEKINVDEAFFELIREIRTLSSGIVRKKAGNKKKKVKCVIM